MSTPVLQLGIIDRTCSLLRAQLLEDEFDELDEVCVRPWAAPACQGTLLFHFLTPTFVKILAR